MMIRAIRSQASVCRQTAAGLVRSSAVPVAVGGPVLAAHLHDSATTPRAIRRPPAARRRRGPAPPSPVEPPITVLSRAALRHQRAGHPSIARPIPRTAAYRRLVSRSFAAHTDDLVAQADAE